MMRLIVFVLLCVNIFVNCNKLDYENKYATESARITISDTQGPGKPLYLTKYIDEHELGKGRRAASVKPFAGSVRSYSGYLTVDKKHNSNLFFWYFRSEIDHKNAPTVVWLQGGPGMSMYLGLFNENGPYKIGKTKIFKRIYTWSKISNLIYFDNPVGTGYSFTENKSGYATNQTKVGADLYEAMVQLFKLFPFLQKNDLFIAGESYGGKYVPALGHTIHIRNQAKPKIVFNLKGLMIGNGLSDPLHMLHYSNYLYQIGLIDTRAKHQFRKLESEASKSIKHHDWKKASHLFDKAIGDKKSLFYKYTGLYGYYNYINPNAGEWLDEQNSFITSDYFRSHVHVGNRTLNDGSEVYKYLHDDIPKSVMSWVVELLRHYRILYYNGQLDVICAYPLTENVLKHMKWPHSHKYKMAKRRIFKVNGEVAGYYKIAGNLMEALIRDAGHMVPADQPLWAFHMFQYFLSDKFNTNKNLTRLHGRKTKDL